MKKWLSTCGELFTCEDKIESVVGDALTILSIIYFFLIFFC
jgi:hypothetical protein